MISQMKYDAFFKEFPFLHQVACGSTCDNITVKRMTPELLNKVPQIDGATGSLVDIEDGEYVTIVTPDQILIDAVKQSESWIHNEGYTDNEGWGGESILDALYRLQAENCTYVVIVEGGYNVVNHHSQDNWQVTIYKPSKEFAVADLIAQAVERAQKQVAAETAL